MPPNETDSHTVKSVGYIGLGNTNCSMASNLLKAGYDFVVHDVDTAKAEKATRG
jgi:3-hydroxyisobutyrate dehydrogenase-like beta-hydroxyacid dehydrogenase